MEFVTHSCFVCESGEAGRENRAALEKSFYCASSCSYAGARWRCRCACLAVCWCLCCNSPRCVRGSCSWVMFVSRVRESCSWVVFVSAFCFLWGAFVSRVRESCSWVVFLSLLLLSAVSLLSLSRVCLWVEFVSGCRESWLCLPLLLLLSLFKECCLRTDVFDMGDTCLMSWIYLLFICWIWGGHE